jgi:hypothetical protein
MEVLCMSKRKSQDPLLYVYQPFSRTPANINMQEVYTNRQEMEQAKEEQQPADEMKKKVSLAKREALSAQKASEITKSENQRASSSQQLADVQQSSFNRVKPFKEMDVLERLDYLINFPKVLPPVPCVFNTVEGSYQGYLSDSDALHVTIKFHDQTSKTLPLDAIKEVLMIGIKKS